MQSSSTSNAGKGELGLAAKLLRNLRPSHQHSAFSATLLLMASVMLARVIGYLREMYVAWAFGAGPKTDAYVAAFTIPDFLFYILAGGTASITFISIYARHTAKGEERQAQQAFNSTITIMTVVTLLGTILVEIFAPQLERLIFPKFTAEQLALCVYLTRILLPGQIFFYAGGIVSAVLYSRRMFLYPALSPVFYGSFIILGGLLGAHKYGIAALAYGALVGSFVGPFLINAFGAAKAGLRYEWSFDWKNPQFREWVRLSIPLMLGVSLVSADDWILRYFASGGSGEITPLELCQAVVCAADLDPGTGRGTGVDAVFRALVRRGQTDRIRADGEPVGVSHLGGVVAGDCVDGSGIAAAGRSGLPARTLHVRRLALNVSLLCVVLALAGAVVGAGTLRARLLCRWRHADADGR